MKDYASKWIAFPDSMAMESASKPYGDRDGFDTTFYYGAFNGSMHFAKAEDIMQVCFNSWFRIDKLLLDGDGKTWLKSIIYHGEDGLAWKSIESYEAKTLNELFSKMEQDGALFDEPTAIACFKELKFSIGLFNSAKTESDALVQSN